MTTARHLKVAGLAASIGMAFVINVNAQGTAAAPPSGTKSTAPPPAAGTTGTSNMAATNKSGKGDLSHSDRNFITKAAGGGLAEVDLGKLAAQKAQDPQIKQFGQRMVDDHSKANDKLKEVAASKNVQLPSALPKDAQREHDKLEKLSGDKFDKEYMSHMVSDHKKDVSEFKSASKSKDADVQKFASETLPTLEQHLQLAQSIEKSK